MSAKFFFLFVTSAMVVVATIQGCKDSGTEPQPAATPPTDDSAHFSTIVQPILTSNCTSCHSGSSPSSGFDQTSYAGVLAGGTQFGTDVVFAGDSTKSKIIKKLRGTAGSRMPLSGIYASTGLPDSLIVKIGEWIMQGAKNN